jgi:uncharacterized protein YukE
MAEAGSGDGGAPLRVDPNAILTARGHLDSVAEELQAALRRLVAEVEDVVGVSWRGEASGVFTRYWQAFHDAAAEVTEDASEQERNASVRPDCRWPNTPSMWRHWPG